MSDTNDKAIINEQIATLEKEIREKEILRDALKLSQGNISDEENKDENAGKNDNEDKGYFVNTGENFNKAGKDFVKGIDDGGKGIADTLGDAATGLAAAAAAATSGIFGSVKQKKKRK